MSIFAGLLDPRIAFAEMDIGHEERPLLNGEDAFVVHAVPRRRREYAAGRACARQALAALGVGPVPLPSTADRLPLWPDGLVGSITHDGSHAAAAVARAADGVRAIGIDIEPAAPLPPGLRDTICRAEEIAWLDKHDEEERDLLARAVFSAKESAFKCQYPLTRRMLEFHEVAVRLDPASGTFVACFLCSEVAAVCGPELHGRMRMTDKLVACAAMAEAA